jgi:Mrp family chromosome partitioning ATPase
MRASKVLMGKRIGVLGKGGSGKSTVVVLLANALRGRGYQVCVLDADSTNVGLHRALGLNGPPRSLLDYFGGMVFRGGSVTCPVDDPTPLQGAHLQDSPGPANPIERRRPGRANRFQGRI